MQQESGLRVSHEAIYAAIYALPRGELRRELIGCLRHAKPACGRKPKGSELRGKLVGMTKRGEGAAGVCAAPTSRTGLRKSKAAWSRATGRAT